MIIIASLISRMQRMIKADHIFLSYSLNRWISGGTVLVTFIIIGNSARSIINNYQPVSLDNSNAELQMFEWINSNTPREAIFLVDPTMSDFYLYAQRSMFVSYKHMPQSADDLLEWYKRLELCNDGQPFSASGYAVQQELRENYSNLNTFEIEDIATKYNIDYFVGKADQLLDYERVYGTLTLTLYKIDQQ